MKSSPRRWSVVAVLVAAAATATCTAREPVSPGGGALLDPPITIVEPRANAVLHAGDSVTISGTIAATSPVWRVAFYADSLGRDTGITIGTTPDGQSDTTRRRRFSQRIMVPPGMWNIVIGVTEGPSSSTAKTDIIAGVSVSVSTNLSLLRPIPDTVFGRNVVVLVSYPDLLTARTPATDMLFDGGTPNAILVSSPYPYSYDDWYQGSSTSLEMRSPKPLTPGRHHLVIRLYSASGSGAVEDSIAKDVVVAIDTISYRLDPLASLSPSGDSRGYDINTSGDVVGYSTDSTRQSQAVVWRGSTLTLLSMPDGIGTRPRAAMLVNDAGVIVGQGGNDNGYGGCNRSIVWRNDVPAFVEADGVCSWPVDVNAKGDVLTNAESYPNPHLNGVVFTPQQLNWANALDDAGNAYGAGPAPDSNRPFNTGSPLDYSVGPEDYWGPHTFGGVFRVNRNGEATAYNRKLWTELIFARPGRPAIDLSAFFTGSRMTVPDLPGLSDNGAVLAFDSTSKSIDLWQAGKLHHVVLRGGVYDVASVGQINNAGVFTGAILDAKGVRVAFRATPVR